MLDSLGLAAVSGRSVDQRMLPKGGLDGDTANTTTTTLAGEEAIASPCKVEKAWTVGSGTYEESDTRADWLRISVTDGGRGWCSVRRAGPHVWGDISIFWISCDWWRPLQENCLCDPFVHELAWQCRESIPRRTGFLQA